MKRFNSLVGCCLLSLASMANPVSKTQALQIAVGFSGDKATSKMKVSYTRRSAASPSKAQNELYYVFNRGDNKGYVVVAGDDRVQPILAWSDTGELTQEDIENHPSIKWLYDEYQKQIEWAIENVPNVPSAEYRKVVSRARNYDILQSPLLALETDRVTPRANAVSLGQAWPFNRYCPNYRYNRSSYPTVSGCVATAIATVMRWHAWPNKAVGSYSYYWNGNLLSVNFDGIGNSENAAYDWNQMPEAVTSGGADRATGYRLNNVQSDNYGRLLRDIGYTVKMNYGPAFTGGSGAYMYDVPRALYTHFGYRNTVRNVRRYNFTSEGWMNEIRKEMDDYGPVIFAGYSKGGGHCFVLDGYATNGFVHVDWGWNGSSNGWHLLHILEPGSQGIGGGDGGYSSGQEMLRYVQPDRNVDPNPEPNPEPNPNPNPGEEVTVGSKLVIASAMNGQKVGQTSWEKITVKVRNDHGSKAWSDYLALGIYKEGDANSQVIGNSYQYISSGAEKEIVFYCDLRKVKAGAYNLTVNYKNGTSYKAIDAVAGTVKIGNVDEDPDPQPVVENYKLILTGADAINEKINQGTSGKFMLTIENHGNKEYNSFFRLYAVSKRTVSRTLISSGNGVIAANNSTNVTFYTNDDFKKLVDGTYTLRLEYNNNGTTDYLRYEGLRDFGKIEIVKNTQPIANVADVQMTTATFYQGGYELGQDNAVVNRKNGTLSTRIYLKSTSGYQDQVYVYLTPYSNGNTADNGLGAYVNIKLGQDRSGYITVNFNNARLRYTRYYLNILFKNTKGEWLYYPNNAVTFVVTGFYDTDPNHMEVCTTPTDGPTFDFNVAPGEARGALAIAIGDEKSGENLDSTTGINDIAADKAFNLIVNDNFIINAPASGVLNIYSVSGALVNQFNVVEGHNVFPCELSAGTYIARMGSETVKFVIK